MLSRGAHAHRSAMTWRIEFDPGRNATSKGRRDVRAACRRAPVARITGLDDARNLGEALKGRLGELWTYRMGDCRIIVDIQDTVC
jgi:mRNA interferase RelE/StbE